MTELQGEPASAAQPQWIGWCCPYCAFALEKREHGLWCAAEHRFFATIDGVHRLLPDERRREVLPVVELERRARREGASQDGAGLEVHGWPGWLRERLGGLFSRLRQRQGELHLPFLIGRREG